MVRLAHALNELDPPVHALVVYNSNPATTAPDSTRVERGLAREDLFTVVLEHFLTDTARYADVVLPATTQVEHVDLVPVLGPHLHHLQRAGHRAGRRGAAQHRDLPAPGAGDGLRRPGVRCQRRGAGARGGRGARAPLDTVDFERLREVGWAEADLPEDFRPFAQGGFGTPSGRLRLWSEDLPPGFDPPPGDDEPLALMTVKSAHHFLNSTYANLPRHLAGEGEPMLDLHAEDAAPRGIADGDVVRVQQRPRRGRRAGPGRRDRRARGGRAALGLVGLAQPGWHHGQRVDDRGAHRPRRRRRLPFRPRRGRAGARTGRRGRQPGNSSSGGPMTRSRLFKLALPAVVALGAGTAVAIAAIPSTSDGVITAAT